MSLLVKALEKLTPPGDPNAWPDEPAPIPAATATVLNSTAPGQQTPPNASATPLTHPALTDEELLALTGIHAESTQVVSYSPDEDVSAMVVDSGPPAIHPSTLLELEGLEPSQLALEANEPEVELKLVGVSHAYDAIALRPEFVQLARQLRNQLHPPGPWCVSIAGPDGTATEWLLPLATAWLNETNYGLEPGRILVVDATATNPGVADVFGIPNSPGFFELLSGRRSADEVIYPSPIPTIDVVPIGGCESWITHEAAKGLVKCLAELRGRYSLVLTLASHQQMAEAAALAAAGDGLLLAIDLDRTPCNQAIQLRGAAQRAGGRLLGCLVRRDQ